MFYDPQKCDLCVHLLSFDVEGKTERMCSLPFTEASDCFEKDISYFDPLELPDNIAPEKT